MECCGAIVLLLVEGDLKLASPLFTFSDKLKKGLCANQRPAFFYDEDFGWKIGFGWLIGHFLVSVTNMEGVAV